MSEEFNNQPSLLERLKNLKINRTAVVSACVLVAAVVIVCAVAIANNRTKDKTQPDDTRPPVTTEDTKKPQGGENTDKAPETEKPTVDNTPTPSTPVDDSLPSFVLPVSGSLMKKHDAANQVYSNTMNDYRVHLGVDILTDESASVYAAADGKIERIWEDVQMGHCIAIKHGGDCYTIYKNLSETLPEGIAEGVSVRSGQLIASVGESAMIEIAEEPHLHFEMTVNDLAVDPLEYFDEDSIKTLGIDASYGN
ncbi:MAG: M23 family metallopeptidase [Ruminococcaceae bacterium]|nr:M23 family metallopeptidase [Oscillospiraceae bacterium]